MLRRMRIKSTCGSEEVVLDLSLPTIFIGPNNSGKSLILKEVERFVQRSNPNAANHLLADLEFDLPSPEESIRMLDARLSSNAQGSFLNRLDPYSAGNSRIALTLETVRKSLRSGTLDAHTMLSFVFSYLIRLDGTTRLDLVANQPAGDLNKNAANFLVALFKNDAARRNLAMLANEAFGKYAVIDPTAMTHLRLKLSDRQPTGVAEEQSLTQSTREFYGRAKHISEFSDGVKSYLGILVALLSGDFRIILLDEPEAFLHPPLASLLARRIVDISKTAKAAILSSTHSSSFLLGAIQSGSNLNIVRLTYNSGRSTAVLLSPDDLRLFANDPLLRSIGTINALFHLGAVVTEADNDRIFYQEINERLCEFTTDGVRGISFLNAQNWQTVSRIASPLRKMGLAAAVIVDLDSIIDKDMKVVIKACNIPQQLVETFGIERKHISQAAKDQNVDLKRQGIFGLDKPARETAHHLLNSLALYGLFVVPVGELEMWLPELNVKKQKTEWILEIFERMGSDPSSTSYVRPSNGDVWQFIRGINAWIANPERMGMSAPLTQ